MLLTLLIVIAGLGAGSGMAAGAPGFLATINPVTYILQGMRHLILEGRSWSHFGGALAAIFGLGVFTISMALAALGWRTS